MKPRPVVTKVGGKIMVAGEYAVLQPGGIALALPVVSGLGVAAWPSPVDRVDSHALGLRSANPGIAALAPVRWALSVVREELGRRAGAGVHLVISGRMVPDLPTGGGLGSSAAVVVGTVLAAWTHWTGELPPPSLALELSLAAHHAAQGGRGSGYDVATVWAGGPGAVAFERAVPLRVARLDPVEGLWMRVVWTGARASTVAMLGEAGAGDVEAASVKELDGAAYAAVVAWGLGDAEVFLKTLAEAEAALRAWDARSGGRVYTSAVERACEVVQSAGAVARVAGAGGGDCITAWALHEETMRKVDSAVQAAGLRTLDVSIATSGPVVHVAGRGVWRLCLEDGEAHWVETDPHWRETE